MSYYVTHRTVETHAAGQYWATPAVDEGFVGLVDLRVRAARARSFSLPPEGYILAAYEDTVTEGLRGVGRTVGWSDVGGCGEVFYRRKCKEDVGLLEAGFRGWVIITVDPAWKAKVTTALKTAGEKVE